MILSSLEPLLLGEVGVQSNPLSLKIQNLLDIFLGARAGFDPTYVAHIPPLRGWYSRDSLCYGVGARMMYINAK